MLETLSIEHFAIIEHAEIRFWPGFTVLTGETGAGKSILIDALSLLMGHRADPGLIRHGAEKADLYACFAHLPKVLRENLDGDELGNEEAPDNCLIRRTVREKSGKVFVNAHPLTGARLRELSAYLVNIYGQHANQALMKSGEQRDRVDRFGKLEKLRVTVREAYRNWQQRLRYEREWREKRDAGTERLDLLRYQLEEFERIAPRENEFATLEKTHQRLAASEEILGKGGQLQACLHESEPSLIGQLHAACQTAAALTALHADFQEAGELLDQAAIYLNEADDSLARTLHRIEHDPARLSELDKRMSALHELARKHHLDPHTLNARWQILREEYNALQQRQASGEALAAESEVARLAYEQAADRLTTARREAGDQLAKEVQEWVRRLGMDRATFAIHLSPAEKPSAQGRDNIIFLLCANPGQTLQPFARVASGGELSRVSLAIEVASLDEAMLPETLIFDEIDTGIGGEVADMVGKLLKRLSRTRQVLCITHLPQVAVWADHHYTIEKNSDESKTQTEIRLLAPEQRVVEIARMLGNAEAGTSREHARAMLERSAERE